MANSNGDINIRVAQRDDIDTLFEIRTSVVENYQSREEIAELGITPESVLTSSPEAKAWRFLSTQTAITEQVLGGLTLHRLLDSSWC